MHEKVHSHTEQQRQPDKQSAAQKMHPMLVAKKQATDAKRDDQVDARTRFPERWRLWRMIRLIVLNI